MLAGYYQHLIELKGLVAWVDYHLLSYFLFFTFYIFFWKKISSEFYSGDKQMSRISLGILGFCLTPFIPWVLPILLVGILALLTYLGVEILLGKFEIKRKE